MAGTEFQNDELKLIYNATPIANIADDAAASPITHLYVAFHTSSPGDAGDQETNEITYTTYARAETDRADTDWTVTDNTVTNAKAITFPTPSAGSGSIGWFSVGIAASGVSKMLDYAQLSSPFLFSAGTPIIIPIGKLTITRQTA